MKQKEFRQSGSIILEALLGIVVLTMVLLAVVPMLSFLFRRSAASRYETQAGFLLQESIEATYNIFAANWTAYPDGTYYPGKSAGGRWTLFAGTEEDLETIYTRSIRIQRACRDQAGEIIPAQGTCGGNLDSDSKVLTANISWQENGQEKNMTAQYLLADLTSKP